MDKETGVSIMKIVPKLDAGPVLIQSKIAINEEINQEELSLKISTLGAKLIIDALELIKNNKANFKSQDETKASYANKIEKSESKISWNDDAKKILAKINALNPKPGCWFDLSGLRIKILKAKEVKISGKPGEIIDQNLTIGCFKNAIQILELKKEGKKKMTTEEFLRGNKIKVGQSLN